MYSDPLIQKYIDLIKANNKEIKSYFEGDPIRVPDSMLPCCIITKGVTRATQMSNVEDEYEIGLNITIITSIRAELSTEENIANTLPGVSKLYDIVEGREKGSYALKASSVLGILRKNQLLDVANNLRTDLSNITRVDYGQTIRQRNPELWSTEARIEIVAQFIQIR